MPPPGPRWRYDQRMGQGATWTPAQRAARLDKLVERNRADRSSFLYEDADWMRDAYEVRGLSLRQMAAEAECGLRTIARWMETHAIAIDHTRKPRRASGEAHPKWSGGPPKCEACGTRVSRGSTYCTSCRERTGDQNPRWIGNAAEYATVHLRLVALRGRADSHSCAHCGTRARDWAYDHLDPNERRSERSRDDGPFSLDPEHYMPLCRPCHRRFDARR